MGSPSTGARAAHTSIARRVAQAHAQIHELLDHLAAESAELGRTRQVLEDLPLILEKHFEDEEQSGGLFDTLRSLQPGVDRQLRSLVDDHREILRGVERLEEYLDRLDHAEGAAERQEQTALLRRETELVVRRIRGHERSESRLTADILYLDEGGSG